MNAEQEYRTFDSDTRFLASDRKSPNVAQCICTGTKQLAGRRWNHGSRIGMGNRCFYSPTRPDWRQLQPSALIVRTGTGCLYQEAGAWSWTLTSIECRSLERVELYLHCPIYLHSCTGTTLFSAYNYAVRQDAGATNQRILHTISESHFSLLVNVVRYNPL